MRWCFFLMSLLFVVQGVSLIVDDLSYQVNLGPGETQQFKIALTNDKDEPEQVEIKQCDYGCNSDGQSFFDPVGTMPRSNASWVSFNSNYIRLAPREKQEVIFTIQVPNQQDLKGSYWSALLIEPSQVMQSIQEAKEGMQLTVKIRYAFHVVTTIGNGNAKLNIVSKDLKTVGEKTYLTVDVANAGEVFLNPKLIVKLYSTDGKLEKTLGGSTERLYPGNSQRYFLDGSDLQGKKWKAFLILDNGDQHLFGDTSELYFP